MDDDIITIHFNMKNTQQQNAARGTLFHSLSVSMKTEIVFVCYNIQNSCDIWTRVFESRYGIECMRERKRVYVFTIPIEE